MSNPHPTLPGGIVAAAALVAAAGVTACGEPPTAAGASPEASASGATRSQTAKVGRARRGGYNVVAD